MATPSKAESFGQIAIVANSLANLYAQLVTHVQTAADTLEQAYEGNRSDEVGAAIKRWKNHGADLLTDGTALLTPLLLDLARCGYNIDHKGDIQTALRGLRREMAEASETIIRRTITRGAVAYGGANVGTGAVYRCYTDRWGHAIEAGYAAQVTTVEVTADKNSGAEASGREVFSIYGAGRVAESQLDLGTAGTEVGQLTAVRSVDCLLQNGSFEDGTGTAASTTAITGWTAIVGAIGTNMLRTAAAAAAAATDGAPFRNKPGATTGQCLQLTAAACTLEQKFSVNSIGKNLDVNKPVAVIARIRPSTGTAFVGTFSYRVGNQTGTLAHGAMAGGWEDVQLVTLNSAAAWYDVFAEDDVRIQVGLSAWTQGSLYVDEILVVQPTMYDGIYYVVTAGQTDWLRDLVADVATFTDTSADTGEIQTWLSRLFGQYLPHAADAGAATYDDV